MRGIVTGASGGIGREIAIELARRGARLALTARRRSRLEQTAEAIQAAVGDGGPAPVLIEGDITDNDLRRRLLAAVQDEFGGLDFLVNNAGVGALGPFLDADEERLRQVMEVNFFAPVELIRAAAPLLGKGRRPMIVNVGSVLGHRGVPNKSEYCAAKFALHGFSDALRAELAGDGVDVLLVSPSTTKTEFFDNVLNKQTEPAAAQSLAMSAQAVAVRTVRAMQAGRHEVILSTGGKLLVWLDRLCPPLANRIIAKFGVKKQPE